MTKHCVDCKHYQRPWCTSPRTGMDLVTGERVNSSAWAGRTLGGCGRSGTWFEPIRPTVAQPAAESRGNTWLKKLIDRLAGGKHHG